MIFKLFLRGLLVIGGLMLLAACTSQSGAPVAQQNADATPRTEPVPREAVPTIDPASERLAAGQRNYNTYCAHCHGYAGEGQHPATIEQTQTYGYNLVPAHDESGHTWQHPDQLLFEVTKYGIRNPLNLYRMTPFGSQLSDDDIFGVIDYMKTFWTDEQREYQQQLTDSYAERDPEWSPQELEDLYAEDESLQD
jgi:cytochrome c